MKIPLWKSLKAARPASLLLFVLCIVTAAPALNGMLQPQNNHIVYAASIAAPYAAATQSASIAASYSASTTASSASSDSAGSAPELLHILSTSDIHCRYLPYDYSGDREDFSGSMAQIASAVKKIRGSSDSSILIDVGDSIQGSLSKTYLEQSIHPFASGANLIGYDVWTLGNHEFNFGPGPLRSVIGQMDASVLCGNVRNPDGSPYAPAYTIIEKNGIKIGVIGMVTPSTSVFAADKLGAYTVVDPLEETKKAVRAIRGKCDVLIAAEHMGLDEELGIYGSGAEDIARECPEIDVILAAHAHTRVSEKFVNGVLITENRKLGKTLSDITVALRREKDGTYRILSKKARTVDISQYEADLEFLEALGTAKALSDNENQRIVGRLDGLALSPDPAVLAEYMGGVNPAAEEEQVIDGADTVITAAAEMQPTASDGNADAAQEGRAVLETDAAIKTASAEGETAESVRTSAAEDEKTENIRFADSLPLAARGQSALTDFINEVQMSYTGADISATYVPADKEGIDESDIRVADLRKIYPKDYTIYKLRISGKQLREYMEWSAAYYDTYDVGGELRPAKGKKRTDCDIFYGVRYKIDVSKPAGQRIAFLEKADGSEVSDDDEFSIAVNRVRAAQLVWGSGIFQEPGSHCKIIQADVRSEYSGLREMIGDYIERHCLRWLRFRKAGETRLSGWELAAMYH